ncbi:LysR family transcriptional regulator [Parendozoicomonas haliclonae]|uniref:HTH-type transcriptional regulator DmlR n=1 Tax=Parendozoicomonas haliclonae TaxID=1960125 RepID=A0A1X7AQ10_9GAMM|nr:LysR family transcriptional regulator [Parendozoicomonas haliclonae]SMA50190.1 HTH-type transcriptional regulator DmlR [Parendozoicomonas haliclonae]
MDKLRNMALFCRVVEQGSFAKAAHELNLTPAIVGRHVASLEQSLGMRLILRTTRSMEITPAGQEYYNGCKRILENVEILEHSLNLGQTGEPKGLIRIGAPDGFAAPYLLDQVASFQEIYPQVQVDILEDNGRTDMVKDHIDLMIRFAIALDDANYIATPLTTTPLALFASPEYIERRGRPTSINDLNTHDCLLFSASRYGGTWPVIIDGAPKKLQLPWRLSFTNTHVLISALDKGLGIGLMPEILARGLSQKELVKIDDLFDFHTVTIYAIYPSREYIPERVRLFLEHLKQTFKKRL